MWQTSSTELMECQEKKDYRPFASKSAALLYLMANTGRPVVREFDWMFWININTYVLYMQLQGTTHLNFAVFAMKQLDPSMPSLSTIKKTFLPGYTPPTKVALQWHACLYAYLHMHMMLMHAWLYLQFLVLHGRKCSILCQFSNNHTQELHGKSDYFILSDSISCVSGQ